MALLDGSLLVESRMLVTDAPLFFFELLQLHFALRARACPPSSPALLRNLAATGVSIGCAISTKWTALATMAIVGIESIRSLLHTTARALSDQHSAHSRQWRASVILGSQTPFALRIRLLAYALRPATKEFVARFVLLLFVPLAIYLLS